MIVGLGDVADLQGFFDSGDPYDRYVWTPWGIEAFAKQVDTEFRSIARDFETASQRGIISSDVLADFNSFYNEWVNYFEGLTHWENNIPVWGAFWWSDTQKTIKAYRERLLLWTKQLTSVGIQPTTPLPGAAGPRGDQNSIANMAGTLTGLAVTVGVVYLGYRVINDTGILRKLAR